MTNPRTQRFVGPAVMIGMLILLVGIAEVILLALSPVEDPRNQIARAHPYINQYIRMSFPADLDLETSSNEGLPGMEGTRRFTTNNYGFRGTELIVPKPADEARVFLVGGSTTECFYLDDEESIDATLQRALNQNGDHYRVFGAGNSGAASDDHIAMISQRIVHLEPDVVVVFCGINDLTRAIFEFDYLHYTRELTEPLRPWHERLILKSQIACRLYILLGKGGRSPRAIQESTSLASNYTGKIGLQRSIAPGDDIPEIDLESYARNLRSLVGLAEAHGFGLLFVTQETTWNSSEDAKISDFHWMRLRNGVTYNEVVMDETMEAYNDIMRNVASETGTALFDLAISLPKTSGFFYDDCHFHRFGAKFFGESIAPSVADLLAYP